MRTGLGGHLTFIVLVVAAYLSLLGAPPGSLAARQVVLALVAGIAYTVAGTSGFSRVERLPTLRIALAYFAAQASLGLAIIHLCELASGIVLLLLPLAGQTVRVLPRWWVIAVCSLLVGSAVLLAGPSLGWPVALRGGVGMLAGVIFIVVFSQVATNEQRARVELDRANLKLREYAAQAEELATIQERNRLAREIHDGLGHN